MSKMYKIGPSEINSYGKGLKLIVGPFIKGSVLIIFSFALIPALLPVASKIKGLPLMAPDVWVVGIWCAIGMLIFAIVLFFRLQKLVFWYFILNENEICFYSRNTGELKLKKKIPYSAIRRVLYIKDYIVSPVFKPSKDVKFGWIHFNLSSAGLNQGISLEVKTDEEMNQIFNYIKTRNPKILKLENI